MKSRFMGKTCKMFCDTFLKNVFGLLSDKFEFYTLIGFVVFDIGQLNDFSASKISFSTGRSVG